ncbi:DUF998 domain-containing protein [Ornithinicoccus hortensis]|uniref:Uncharacterized protein DUF998 n=1 Tax=Ornithinicoccus hortensis TaxID=82346 RepID=A0A542YTA8_9MICO|nr:DUF998 domain-containing protein [Ornithinicoccus hortensis]TQL51332.1 uncharacterized protein DUF998 [Ornithinicoccus hortensis]
MTALLVCGIVGAVGFVGTFLLDGATRPGYRPTYHPVSALALGPRGWLQAGNFIGSGALIGASGVGVGMATGSLLLGTLVILFGAALVASGVFPMDPMRGYPPGTPEGTPEETSRAHELHDHAGAAVFSLLPAAAAVAAFVLDGRWAWASGLVAVGLVALFVAFGYAWEGDRPRAGLVQRVLIVLGWAWLAVLCWSLLP